MYLQATYCPYETSLKGKYDEKMQQHTKHTQAVMEIVKLYNGDVANFEFEKDFKLRGITFEVGYWRKANAIHHWFVKNVQDGNDDCGKYDVSEEKIDELIDSCQTLLSEVETAPSDLCYAGESWDSEDGHKNLTREGEVITNPEVAANILPTTEGFFFGCTDYDDYYLESVKDTLRIATRAKHLINMGFEIDYQASW